MGLDMYLTGKRFLSDYSPDDADQLLGDEIKYKCPELRSSPYKVTGIEIDIAYWRKANAIHKWFVDHVQNGEDNCLEHHVDIQQFSVLLDTINKVLEDPTQSHELLPTTTGFFFGSTDYDDGYIQDLQYTKDVIEKLLESNLLKSWNVYYRSSW